MMPMPPGYNPNLTWYIYHETAREAWVILKRRYHRVWGWVRWHTWGKYEARAAVNAYDAARRRATQKRKLG